MITQGLRNDDNREEVSSYDDNKPVENVNKNPGIMDLFRPRLVRLRTLNMFYQWFAVTLAYYGLSFSSTDLAGDKYSNFCASVAVEIPGM